MKSHFLEKSLFFPSNASSVSIKLLLDKKKKKKTGEWTAGFTYRGIRREITFPITYQKPCETLYMLNPTKNPKKEAIITSMSHMKFQIIEVAQVCLTPCNPKDRNPPRSSIHRNFQARIPEWVAISLLQENLSTSGIEPVSLVVSYTGRRILYHCISWEATIF